MVLWLEMVEMVKKWLKWFFRVRDGFRGLSTG